MPRFKKASDIRVGVVGYGGFFSMGQLHLSQIQKIGMLPVAVADLDAERLAVAQAQFPGIETYQSLETMLTKSHANLIFVVTPHNTHAKLALTCLRAGRHVVCEKPMAITTAECDRMIETARRKRLLLSTFHNRHWDGCILQAVKTIRSGAIGQIFRVRAYAGDFDKPGTWWRSSKSISGGVSYDWGVHTLEQGLQLIDSDIVEVSGFDHRGYWAAKSPWKHDSNEDEASAVVRFRNGAWLSMTISELDSHPSPHWFEITGTEGTYLYDHATWQMVKTTGVRTVTTKGKNPGENTLWHRYYENLRDHLVKGKPLIITAEWARRPIHILDLAGRSARKGAAIKAKYK